MPALTETIRLNRGEKEHKVNLSELREILNGFKGKRIAVIGDMMVDHYLWGQVDRVSPEAPVPVVDVEREEYRLGGAANVVSNLKALGAEPYPIGVTGEDIYSDKLKSMLRDLHIESRYLIADQERVTTLKSRIIAHNQQVVRIDRESRRDINGKTEEKISEVLESLSSQLNGIIIEDYNKGLLTAGLIKQVLQTARKASIPVTVDPKFKNFFLYEKATIFKPNFAELQKNTGLPIENEKDFDYAAGVVMQKMKPRYLVITRGDKGLVIFKQTGERINIPTFAKEVFDVSGAGDTVISSLTLGLCSGLDIEKAALIANHSAGAVCGKIGIHPANPEDILESFREYNPPTRPPL